MLDAVLSDTAFGAQFHKQIEYHPNCWRNFPNDFEVDRLNFDAQALYALRDVPHNVVVMGVVARNRIWTDLVL